MLNKIERLYEKNFEAMQKVRNTPRFKTLMTREVKLNKMWIKEKRRLKYETPFTP